MDACAAVVDDFEESLDVQDHEDLREHSESMCEGLAMIHQAHAKMRRKIVSMKRRLLPQVPLSQQVECAFLALLVCCEV